MLFSFYQHIAKLLYLWKLMEEIKPAFKCCMYFKNGMEIKMESRNMKLSWFYGL